MPWAMLGRCAGKAAFSRQMGASMVLCTPTLEELQWSTEEKRLGYLRAVRGRTGKVVKKRANLKTSQRGQPRPLRAESQGPEDWAEAKDI